MRGARVLVEDESTASVDTRTDAVVKELMASMPGVTRLIIAHRLNSVINTDKILMLDAGEVLELDKPSRLLAKPEPSGSAAPSRSFKSLVISTGAQSSQHLIKLASLKEKKDASNSDDEMTEQVMRAMEMDWQMYQQKL